MSSLSILQHNRGTKCVAVLIAVLLYWFVNAESNSAIVRLNVPIHFKNLPENLIIVAPLQARTQVSVRGPKTLLARVVESQYAFSVDLSKIAPGKKSLSLRPEHLGLDPYFAVVGIEPAQLELTAELLLQKELPVKIDRIGEIKTETNIENLEAVPNKVQIRGPASEVEQLKFIKTPHFDISEIKESTSQIMQLLSPGPLSTLTPSSVVVNIKLSPQEVSTTFQKLAIELRAHSGTFYNISPETVDVTVKGAPLTIGALTSSEIVPYVKLKAGESSVAGYRVSVELPQGIELIKINPDTVVAQQSNGTRNRSDSR